MKDNHFDIPQAVTAKVLSIAGAVVVGIFIGSMAQNTITNWNNSAKIACAKLQTLGLEDETKWDDDFGCLARRKSIKFPGGDVVTWPWTKVNWELP